MILSLNQAEPAAYPWMTSSHSAERATLWLFVCGWTTRRMTSTWGKQITVHTHSNRQGFEEDCCWTVCWIQLWCWSLCNKTWIFKEFVLNVFVCWCALKKGDLWHVGDGHIVSILFSLCNSTYCWASLSCSLYFFPCSSSYEVISKNCIWVVKRRFHSNVRDSESLRFAPLEVCCI